MYDEGLRSGVESNFFTGFLVVQLASNPSAVGHHAEVKLISWRYRVAEPMKRGAKDSEARAVISDSAAGRRETGICHRFHYPLKSGCGMEELQLNCEKHLVKALATYSIVAGRLLWLTDRARLTTRRFISAVAVA
jgi:hypothetical protein